MKFTTCCIPLLILTHSALAETRNLTLDWHFAKDGDKTEYLLDWPLITSKNGTAFTIRDTNGNLHLQATLKDPHKKELFTTDNVIGKYRYYYPSGKLKKQVNGMIAEELLASKRTIISMANQKT